MLNSPCVPTETWEWRNISFTCFTLLARYWCFSMAWNILPCFTQPSSKYHVIRFTPCCTILYLAIAYHRIWWDMIAHQTYNTTPFILHDHSIAKTISCNTILHLIANAQLYLRRTKNRRIFPWQWQHFMWHSIPHHVPHHTSTMLHHTSNMPHHTDGILCLTITTPRFPASGNILCDTQPWVPPTHSLAFHSHLLPWISPRILNSNWTGTKNT